MCGLGFYLSHSDNVVLYNHIMILRDKLGKLKNLKGLRSDDKGNLVKLRVTCYYVRMLDPEEFLNLLFKHVLNIEAFLQIKYVYTCPLAM